nr:PD-(D/E)XK nuclease family protein [Alphaproteobacteria bacterium]
GAKDHFAASEKRTTAAKSTKQILPITNLPPIAARPISVTQYLQQKYSATAHVYTNSHLATDRGVVMHRLLELLPRITPPQQRDAALRFIRRQMPQLPEITRMEWVDEVLEVIGHPQLALFFSPTAQAEVPITGRWKNHHVMGIVDRFYVTDDELKILDFKTTAEPPAAMPPQYTEQLQIYAKILAELYPNHRVGAGILWTVNLRLDWLDAENLRLVA